MPAMFVRELPDGFPEELTITLKKGIYNNLVQFWASFSHDGREHKLVISLARYYGPMCEAGETWLVRPENSPNGHIVFCRLVRQLKTASGMHPVIEALLPFVRAGAEVTITKPPFGYEQIPGWKKTGMFTGVIVEGSHIKLGLVGVRHQEGSHDGRWSAFSNFSTQIGDFVFQCAEWGVKLREVSPSETILRCIGEDGIDYEVQFTKPKQR
jgi:hypothetical protein